MATVAKEMNMKKAELVFIPAPAIGHLASMVELAKHLIERDKRFSSITVLIMKPPTFSSNYSTYIDSLSSSTSPSIRFIHLPPCNLDSSSSSLILDINNQAPETLISLFIEAYKPQIKQTIITDVIRTRTTDSSVRLAGLVIDLFFTTIIDVGNELGLPTYVYITSTAAMLGLMLHLPHIKSKEELTDDLETTELRIPCFTNSLPPPVLPLAAQNKEDDSYGWFLYHGRRFRETKGIMVNTFHDLEPGALDSFLAHNHEEEIQIPIPPVYAVGPLLDLKGQTQLQPDRTQQDKIMSWLDVQPPCSVIFLCFGSMGSFGEQQVREIAIGLERSGHRFLWSLRQPPKTKMTLPTDYTDHKEVLPEGFLERTKGRGLVCGWVQQVAVLGHSSVGGFVSHCGWNSVLESLWFGVPIVTWPLYAEQQLNAFELVRELGLAVELRLDSRIGGTGGGGGDVVVVGWDEIERAVRCVMHEGEDNQVRRKVKDISEKGRKAVMDKNGSSYVSLGHLIEEMMEGISE